jgi:hypothetical protein
MRVINKDTFWETEFDPSIQTGNFVEVIRWYGKNKGIWKVLEVDQPIVNRDNQKDFGGPMRPGGFLDYAPLGMYMTPRFKLQRVMNEDFERPHRRDTTMVDADEVVKITPDYIVEKQSEYTQRIANLNKLLAGAWN